MKLYTGNGDNGRTRDATGREVSKSDLGLCAIGTLDELSAHIGLCLAACTSIEQRNVREALAPIQTELTGLGTAVANTDRLFDVSAIDRMERLIDSIWSDLGELKSFILPGGCELACQLHVARTVCRRAERAVVAWAESGADISPTFLQYLNRLSDLLFALARLANQNANVEERPWKTDDDQAP